MYMYFSDRGHGVGPWLELDDIAFLRNIIVWLSPNNTFRLPRPWFGSAHWDLKPQFQRNSADTHCQSLIASRDLHASLLQRREHICLTKDLGYSHRHLLRTVTCCGSWDWCLHPFYAHDVLGIHTRDNHLETLFHFGYIAALSSNSYSCCYIRHSKLTMAGILPKLGHQEKNAF